MYNKLIEKIETADITLYTSGGVENSVIIEAETILGVEFPNDFKEYLSQFGSASFGSVEIGGLLKNVDLLDPVQDNSVGLSKEAYEKYSLFNKVIILGDAGMGDQYALNCDKESANYGKMFYWNPGLEKIDNVEYFSDSFYDFFKTKIDKITAA